MGIQLLLGLLFLAGLTYVAWNGIRVTVGQYWFNFIGLKNM